MGFELTTLVVIGTDCTGSCKSNYHAIMTAPYIIRPRKINILSLRLAHVYFESRITNFIGNAKKIVDAIFVF
jgi:hypothetical protein